MSKEFQSYDEQIRYLREEKNLVIEDEAGAKDILYRIGYFALINGYKALFKNPTTKKYIDGTRIEHIVSLYTFDEELRELFLKYILKVERNMRSLISYYFTEKYGIDENQYLCFENYNRDKGKNDAEISQLIDTLRRSIEKKTDHLYIEHYKGAYKNVPLWVLINGITFGSLSKFYAYITQDVQAKVAKHFGEVREKGLEKFLGVITKYRNICAHGERLFTCTTKKDIPDTRVHIELGIPRKGAQYIYGKHDLYAVVIALKYLLTAADFKVFIESLKETIESYLAKSGSINKNTLYQKMGFPDNWYYITEI